MGWQFSTVLPLCYLLEIFAKLGENEVLQARPSSLHFNGFTVGKVHSRKLVGVFQLLPGIKCHLRQFFVYHNSDIKQPIKVLSVERINLARSLF